MSFPAMMSLMISPNRSITAVRNDNGTWSFKVNPDFSALIREVGVLDQAAAMSAIIQEVKLTRTRARRGARRA